VGPAVILFDGVCNLCNAFVRFVIERDPRGRFAFAPLQSQAAARLSGGVRQSGPASDSVMLLEPGTVPRVSVESTAILRIARGLGWPWALAYAFIAVPRPVRDWLYRLVARGRYRWFGRRDACMIPTASVRARFIE
jgi:predicted DCC family thiol-disulfide oxidoreductase YuxK